MPFSIDSNQDRLHFEPVKAWIDFDAPPLHLDVDLFLNSSNSKFY